MREEEENMLNVKVESPYRAFRKCYYSKDRV